jgi:tricorn protease
VLPTKRGNYADLQAIKASCSIGGAAHRLRDEKSPIVYFDFGARRKDVLDEADAFEATVDGKKLFVPEEEVRDRRDQAGAEVREADGHADIEVPVDPRAEWRQIFTDAYRFERDFFYDPSMHGVRLERPAQRYGKLLEDAVTRWDVELRASASSSAS